MVGGGSRDTARHRQSRTLEQDRWGYHLKTRWLSNYYFGRGSLNRMEEGTPRSPLAEHNLFHLRSPTHTAVCCQRELRTGEVPGRGGSRLHLGFGERMGPFSTASERPLSPRRAQQTYQSGRPPASRHSSGIKLADYHHGEIPRLFYERFGCRPVDRDTLRSPQGACLSPQNY